ncbi:MAG: DUF4361 domain-containing protein [Prevotellaceae bacterium]|jgi:hypothetical protein|nr:DUF4361 domain-containing protein [Prevotellaceae bacterium]
MRKHIILCLLTAISVLTISVSCNEYGIFEDEMYKKVFAIVSSADYNVFPVEHDLEQDESTGYIAASMGGSTPADRNLTITMVHSSELMDMYNRANFVEAGSYAKILSPTFYDIDDYHIGIAAGERQGKMKIRVRPEGLSPDSIYFISLKVGAYDCYEVNPQKSDILYRVLLKNKWAAQKTPTNYMQRGTLNAANVFGSKRMFPLTKNRVRITAGNEPFSADTASINSMSIVLEIGQSGSITISPYKNLDVQQVDGDPNYPNIYFIENDGYRTYRNFLLRYDYRKNNDQTVYEMREELRLEFKETDK